MNEQEFSHIPVLLAESIADLHIRADGIYVDCTLGGAGHSREIARRLNSGLLIAFDQDAEAIAVSAQRLAPYGERVKLVHRNFAFLDEELDKIGVDRVDGVLMDLGVSSRQFDTPQRGFSYRFDAPLDMRMSGEGPSAYDIVNGWDEAKLSQILWAYGEEKYARSIARIICRRREREPIRTTGELCEIIRQSMPAAARRDKHPAKKSFQAIRIAVNDELNVLERALDSAFARLAPGGRVAVITFHSLEDRIVKQRFAALTRGCTCPPEFPVCVCGKTPQAKYVHKKPLIASLEERARNPRSASAHLRCIEKLPPSRGDGKESQNTMTFYRGEAQDKRQ